MGMVLGSGCLDLGDDDDGYDYAKSVIILIHSVHVSHAHVDVVFCESTIYPCHKLNTFFFYFDKLKLLSSLLSFSVT